MATFLIWLPFGDSHLINLTIHKSRPLHGMWASVAPLRGRADSRRVPGEASGGGLGSLLQPDRLAQGPEGTVCNPDL
jgi:hypothetical protein